MREDLIDISDTCTGLSQVYNSNDIQYAYTNGIGLDESSVINQNQGRQGWIWLSYATCLH